MLLINRKSVEALIARLSNPVELERCRDEVKRMLKIESELLWWAESGKCCRWEARPYFDGRIQLLERVLTCLNQGDTAQASSLLREYASQQSEDGTGIMLR